MSGERLFVRSVLTLVVVAISLVAAPFMLGLKLLEGVYVCWGVTEEAVRQVWAAKGIPEFDRFTTPKE